MEKKLHGEDAWVPLTPTKPIPARLGVESTNREWKVNLGRSFQHMSLQKFLNFDAMISGNSLYIRDEASASLREGLGLDLNKNIPSLDGEGSNRGFAEVVFAENFSKENLNGAIAENFTPSPMKAEAAILRNSFGIPSAPSPMKTEAACKATLSNSSIIPPTPPPTSAQAAHQAIEGSIFQIRASPQHDKPYEVQEPPSNKSQCTAGFATDSVLKSNEQISRKRPRIGEIDSSKKQKGSRPRMKKHRPKVVVEWKAKKAPKFPTPKAPKTPKASSPKQRVMGTKSCKRALKFNLKDQGIVEDNTEAFVISNNLLQEKSGDVRKDELTVSENSGDSQSREQTDVEVVFFLDNVLSKRVTAKRSPSSRMRHLKNRCGPSESLIEDLEQQSNYSNMRKLDSSEKYDRKFFQQYRRRKYNVQKLNLNSNLGVQESAVCIEMSNVSAALTIAELNNGKNEHTIEYPHVGEAVNIPVTNQTGCVCSSLRVYQRTFRVNQCQTNSRKLGPIFPRIFKKKRTKRKKAAAVKMFWYIDAEIQKKKLKRGKKGPMKFKAYDNSEIAGLQMISPKEKQTTKAVNDPEPFKCVLSLPPIKVPRRKRSKMLTRKHILPSANMNPEQYGLVLSDKDLGMNGADDSEGKASSLHLTERDTIGTQNAKEVSFDNPVTFSSPVTDCSKIQKSHFSVPDIEDYVGNCFEIQKFPAQQEVCVHNIQDCAPIHQDVLSTNENADLSFMRGLTDVIQKLESLHINEVRDETGHGVLVKFDLPRKYKKNVAKVDLDEDSLMVWNLVQQNGGQPFDKMDKDKEEWWEKQREVFRGRVDSFVARMHVIQGNRRFSPWKGSVVDSVVGVYLTQNVSDHLSSSAFMSLAARFPPKSTRSETYVVEEITYSRESVGSSIEVDRQMCDRNESELGTGHQFQDALRDEIPEMEKFPPKSTSCCSETPVVEGIACGQQSFGSSIEVERQVCDRNGIEQDTDYQFGDAIRVEILETRSEQILSNAVPSQKLEGPFHTENTMTHNELFLGELQSEMENHLQKYTLGNENLPSIESQEDGNLKLSGEKSVEQSSSAVVHNSSEPCTEALPFDLNVGLSDPFENFVPAVENNSQHQARARVVRNKVDTTPRKKKSKLEEKQETKIDWDELRKSYCKCSGQELGRNSDTSDCVDWEAVRCSTEAEISETIKDRGMNNVLAKRIKEFLDRIYKDHGSLDLEWLRDVPPEKAKEYLLSIDGLGLKSVECVRLLTLHHLAFPVDTNVARVAVRLGWVPLQPLPESLQLHLLNAYPLMDTIQKYLWPRLCTLSQPELYELHYQMITFGKVFCTKRNPNCNACPMRGECRHYASKIASSRPLLTKPEEKSTMSSDVPFTTDQNPSVPVTSASPRFFPAIQKSDSTSYRDQNCEPIIEVPPSPVPESTNTLLIPDIEDFYIGSDDDDIPTIRLNTEECDILDSSNFSDQGCDKSQALVALSYEAASAGVPKLKHVSRLRTVHQVYELPDSHPLLTRFEKRQSDDVSPYLLAIWPTASSETVESSKHPLKGGNNQEAERNGDGLFSSSCTAIQAHDPESVWGTILIPCRSANGGYFPLNGTYFQVNEVFADDESSQHPIRVPRAWLWNLRRCPLHCGTSATSIFRGLLMQEIHHCFWGGYICVRGFNKRTKYPRRLAQRFHLATNAEKTKAKFDE